MGVPLGTGAARQPATALRSADAADRRGAVRRRLRRVPRRHRTRRTALPPRRRTGLSVRCGGRLYREGVTDPREDYLHQIRRGGLDLPPELAAAFASVPREAFVPEGFQRRDGTWVRPADPDFLDIVYSDDVLITKVDGRMPISSSSQPSLMAIMILALRVTPGMRVLEIGAGTGYNAALLASLGATITSIDVQEDVAVRARSALARAGIAGVRVQHGDGYSGVPGSHFDRVIVTVGIGGVSPHWLEQLDPGGFVLAPIVH